MQKKKDLPDLGFLQSVLEDFVRQKEAETHAAYERKMVYLEQKYQAVAERIVNNQEIGQHLEGRQLPEAEMEQMRSGLRLILEEQKRVGFTLAEAEFFECVDTLISQKSLPLGVKELLMSLKDSQFNELGVDTGQVGELLTEMSLLMFRQDPYRRVPLVFKLESLYDGPATQALAWTCFDIWRLDLPGLSFEKLHLLHPSGQCWWCGSPLNEEGQAFPEEQAETSRKFCYLTTCERHNKSKKVIASSYYPRDYCCACMNDNYRNNLHSQIRQTYAKSKQQQSFENKMRFQFSKLLKKRYDANYQKDFPLITRF